MITGLLIHGLVACIGVATAADWTTTGNDAQRSHWVRTDPKISAESLGKPGFEFLWKIKFDNEASQSNSLSPIVLFANYTGYRGHKYLGFLGGSANNIFAVDTDLGLIHWQNHHSPVIAQRPGSTDCPGGMTSAVTRPTSASTQDGFGFGGGPGRRSAARSGAGTPGEGAVTLSHLPPPRPSGGRSAPVAPPVRPPALLYALTSDGMLQTMYVSNGSDAEPATSFLPANSNASGLIVVDKVAYVSTSNRCGSVTNGVWALDLESKQVSKWDSGSAGSSAPAFGPDGTLYVTAGVRVVALEPKTLKVKSAYTGTEQFISAPVVFEYHKKLLLAAATGGGAIHLLDSRTESLSKAQMPSAIGSLASWQDSGDRWILASGASSVEAWKVVEQDGAPVLRQGWTSRKMAAPLTPMIVNGVVFAASRQAPVVLYALDAKTGKELWNSGNTIASFIDSGGLSAGGTQVYLQTHDGTLYAFGFPIEH